MSPNMDSTLQPENRNDHVWSTESFDVYEKPGELYARKIGVLGPPDLSNIQEQLDIGREIQGFWMRFFASREGIEFKDADYAMFHPSVAMASHYDYISADGQMLYEIKNLSHHQRKFYGEDGSDHIHPRYRAQCLHEAACHGLTNVTLVAAFGGQTVQHFPLAFSADEIDAHVQKVAQFWAKVQTRTPPEDSSEEAIRALYPVSRPASIVTTAQVQQAVRNLAIVKENLKKLEEQESTLRDAIVSYIGQNDTLIDVDGSVLATFKSAKPSKKFDSDTFKKEMPEVYERYSKVVDGSRRFLIK